MKRKENIIRCNIIILLLLFGLLNTVPVWSEESMDVDASLENILKRENVIVEIYLIPFNIYTVVPISERVMRDAYSWKIVITSKVLNNIKELLFSAQEQMYGQPEPLNIRTLIDIRIDNEIVYTIPLSHGLGNELLEAFHRLLRIPLDSR